MIDLWRRMRAGSRLGESGASAVEFAIVVSVLLIIVLGTAQFGIAFNYLVTLTNATTAGATQFSISRGSSTPCTSAVQAVQAAAPTLTPANMPITLAVNGTACANTITATSCPAATDTACANALTATPKPPNITVSAWYPWPPQYIWYTFWTSGANCTSTPALCLAQTMTEYLQ